MEVRHWRAVGRARRDAGRSLGGHGAAEKMDSTAGLCGSADGDGWMDMNGFMDERIGIRREGYFGQFTFFHFKLLEEAFLSNGFF
jgi:hypothetical protein